jgi:S1-C subfamily serine protease
LNEAGPQTSEGRRSAFPVWLAAGLLLAGLVAGAAGGATASLILKDDNGGSPTVSSRRAADEGAVALVVDAVLPSVVSIINEQDAVPDGAGNLVQDVNAGSGVIVDERGYILTNDHVIRSGGKLTVVLNNGEERPATVVGSDAPFTDIAVIKIAPGGLKPLPFGDSDSLVLGQGVVAIGSAYFEYKNSVTSGIVSGLHRRWLREGVYMEDMVQTDAAINIGNSGGPLVNFSGEVIGLNTNVVRSFGTGDTVFGIAFAISSKTMSPIVKSIIDKGQYPRPYFGIDHQTVDYDLVRSQNLKVDHGALVSRVIAGSPAAKAGLRTGDVILRIGKVDLTEEQPFINALSQAGVNESVPVQVFRDGRVSQLTIDLVPR